MTPEELLQDLRDIHLPAPPQDVARFDIAFEPFVVVALLVLIAAIIAYHRRYRWRAQARARLHEIEREPATAQNWLRLVELTAAASRRSRTGPPPDCVYLPVERVGPDDVAELGQFVRTALRQ